MIDALGLSVAELLKLGFAGVIIVALAWVAWRLWSRVETLQDKRVEDAQKLTALVEANTVSREKHTAAIESLTELMRDVQIRGRR